MEYIGIDVHKNQSRICIITERGEYVERTIRTARDRFRAVLGNRKAARILIESSTESEWVARCLTSLGHEVIVADPNYAPMYAHRSRRIKTDRRDARALAEACRHGTYRQAHRASVGARGLKRELAVRDVLVRTRVRSINLIRAVLRQEGLRVRSGSSVTFALRVKELALPKDVARVIRPLIAVLRRVEQQMNAIDARFTRRVQRDELLQRLCTVTGVGPVTVSAYVAAVDDPDRFRDARQVASYLGLVPSERSSGERQRRGRITKAGDARVRRLLVEAAWSVMRSCTPQMEMLRRWARGVALRRGKRVAAVALGRRLARILYALWRDGTVYEPPVGDDAHVCAAV